MEAEKNIILVDDHVLMREGLKELIEKIGPYRVSRQYDSGTAIVQDFPLFPVPDLLVMDISMPGMDGDEVIDIMNSQGINVPVLILTLIEDDHRLIKLFRKGARGCLNKNCTADLMRRALTEIFEFGFYHNELLARALTTDEKNIKQTGREVILQQLTHREKIFLKLICHEDEYTYAQIADIMNVQFRTIDGYREAIFEKFNIKSKTGIVLFVLKHGLIDHLN
jgi:DNA-binding NarL/FixJ family response regulator